MTTPKLDKHRSAGERQDPHKPSSIEHSPKKLWQSLTPQAKEKLDYKARVEEANPKSVKDKIKQWQELVNAGPLVPDDSISQRGRLDLPQPKHPSSSPERQATKAKAGTLQNSHEKLRRRSRSKSPAAAPLKGLGSTFVGQTINAENTPRRRVVSDGHWRKERELRNGVASLPRPRKSKLAGQIPNTATFTRPDGTKYEAWVRERTPVKPKTNDDDTPTPQREAERLLRSDPGRSKREADNAGEDKLSQQQRKIRSGLLYLAAKYPPKARDPPQKRDPGDTRLSSLEREAVEGASCELPNGRIEAWLTTGPDPFVDNQRDPAKYPTKPASSFETISYDPPRKLRPQATRPMHASTDEAEAEGPESSSSPSSTLKRRGARRMSQIAKSPYQERSQSSSRKSDIGHSPITQSQDASKGLQLVSTSKSLVSTTSDMISISSSAQRWTDPLSKDALDSLNPKSTHRDKPKMTSHADLISVLSMPVDTQNPLRPARSLRARPSKSKDKIEDLLASFSTDEEQYKKDLQTLIDGVIPVLLKAVLARSKASRFPRSNGTPLEAGSTTAPIVGLGIALERLRTTHRRVSTSNAESFVKWAQTARSVYADYVLSWRSGFEGMTINLSPSEGSDVQGETAEVAYLLKRPLVRIKHVAKILKGISLAQSLPHCASEAAEYQELLRRAKKRQEEEQARLEDEGASSIDVSKTRALRTLAPVTNAVIDPARSVRARDYFDLHIHHSTGQVLDCRTEFIYRDNGPDKTSGGDLLICEIDSTSRWLLFPAFNLDQVSARIDASGRSVTVMLREESYQASDKYELLIISTNNRSTLQEWVQMLGSTPNPPAQRPQNELSLLASAPVLKAGFLLGDSPVHSASLIHVPIGEVSVTSSGSESSFTADVKSDLDSISSSELGSRPRQMSPGTRRSTSSALTPTRVRKVAFEDDKPRSQSPQRPDGRSLARDADSLSVSSGQDKGYSVWMPSHDTDGEDKVDHESSRRRYIATGSTLSLPSDNLSDYGQAVQRLHDIRSGERERIVYSSPTKPHNDRGTSRSSTPLKSSRSDLAKRTCSQSPSPVLQALDDVGTPPLRPMRSPHSTPRSTSRRASSPLKHEYDPSSASEDGSSVNGILQSDDEGSIISESSVDDDLVPPPPPLHVVKRDVGRHQQLHALTSPSTLPPSQSASQACFRQGSTTNDLPTNTAVASIFSWSDRGLWQTLHPEECSIVVSPGLIEAFKMTSAHSGDRLLGGTQANTPDSSIGRPLLALELTPLVPLRRGTAIDISVRSPPTANSLLKASSNIMFRSRNNYECELLYSMINQSRINNATYIALQNARGPYGHSNWSANMDRQISRAPSSWRNFLGRSGSYRAGNTRRTASVMQSESSVASMSSAISALKRFSAGSKFYNVAKSTITSKRGGPHGSRSTTTFSSSSGIGGSGSSTPIRAELAQGAGAGITDSKIRIYKREGAGKWRDMGSARLTIMHPPRPPGAPPQLDKDGRLIQEKRILVISKASSETILDVTLGESSFERVARTGLAVSVWEEFGKVANTGGVNTARANVFMMQMKSEAEAAHAFSLVGRLRY